MSSPPLPIKTPPALRRGDTVAFLSPSSRLNTVFPLRISRARLFLEREGFKVTEVFAALPADHNAAVKQRVDEIHNVFSDPNIKAIIPTIGGHALSALLPHIDYNLIRAHPKILLGYSDLTLLHHAIYAKAGVRTYYGPAAITQLGEYPHPIEGTWEGTIRALMPEETEETEKTNEWIEMPPAQSWTQEFLDFATESEPGLLRARTLQQVSASDPTRQKILLPADLPAAATTLARGPIFGGCIPSLVQLLGTPYTLPLLSSWAGSILLLELPESLTSVSDAYPLYLARKDICDIRNAGVLGVVAGIVVGRPRGFGGGGAGEVGSAWQEWEKMLVGEFEGLDVPVLANVSVGHTDPVLTVPLGAECEIGVDGEGCGWWRVRRE